MAEAICGILATVCLDICTGICLDFASTRKMFSGFIFLRSYTDTSQAAHVRNTFSLVLVVHARA